MPTRTKPPTAVRRRGEPFDEARAALDGIGKDLRTGGRDLYRDVERFARNAWRDTSKLGRALRRDVGRLVKAEPRPRTAPHPAPKHAARAPRRRPAEPHIKKTAA